jgi:tetratricopeptide (TPR) repeat protein
VTRPRSSLSTLALFLALLAAPLVAQPPAEIQDAVGLLQQQSWDAAADKLEAFLEKEPGNAIAWYRLSQARRGQARWSESLKAVQRAREHGFTNANLLAVIEAEARAGLGEAKVALSLLEEVAEGGSNRAILAAVEGGAGFASLSSDPRWAKVVEKLTPCTGEDYRAFDFWLGDFRVVLPSNGTYLGDNTVSQHLGGCLVMEHWRGASGQDGMSMNFYDPAAGTWTQVYLDNGGAPANWPRLEGGLDANGAMVLLTPEGETQSRWTWTKIDDRTVRQMAETTNDGGKTWQVVWDSHYVRKE